jgi:hypothetical protein
VRRGPCLLSVVVTCAALFKAPEGHADGVVRVGLVNVVAGDGGRQTIAALRARLEQRPSVALPRDAARAALEEPLADDSDGGDGALRLRASQLLRAAQDGYSRFDYDGALERLRQADLTLATASPSVAVAQLLVDINLLVGVVEADRGDVPRALDAFRVVQRLAPGRKTLDPGSFRPRVVALYAQAMAPASDPRRSRLSVVTDPAGASVWLDGRPAGTAPKELTLDAGFHYVAAVVEGSTPRLEKPVLRAGEASRVTLLLARLPPEERARQARADLGAGRTSWAHGAAILASAASVDFLVLVRGARDDAQQAAIYDARSGALGPWMAAAPAEPVLTALAIRMTPAPTTGGPAFAPEALARDPSPAVATAWYRSWWVVPPLLVAGAAAALGTLWIIDRERTTTYTINRWCFDRTCSP